MSKMVNFHLDFSCQWGNRYRFIRFHLRLNPKQWCFGNRTWEAGNVILYRMYCLGPFGIQWG